MASHYRRRVHRGSTGDIAQGRAGGEDPVRCGGKDLRSAAVCTVLTSSASQDTEDEGTQTALNLTTIM